MGHYVRPHGFFLVFSKYSTAVKESTFYQALSGANPPNLSEWALGYFVGTPCSVLESPVPLHTCLLRHAWSKTLTALGAPTPTRLSHFIFEQSELSTHASLLPPSLPIDSSAQPLSLLLHLSASTCLRHNDALDPSSCFQASCPPACFCLYQLCRHPRRIHLVSCSSRSSSKFSR